MFKSAAYVFNLSTSYLLGHGHRPDRRQPGPVAPFVTHRGRLDRWQEFFTTG
jgi:hypothetical protein